MSTAEDNGATAKDAGTNSYYAGAGAGGKSRKKPIRRQTTPYDRPPAAPRVDINNANSNSTWLTKLVLEPASRIISYGAHRLFGSVFTPHLPPPQPPQPLELNHNLSEGLQRPVADLKNLYGAQEFAGGEHGIINSAGYSEISELEQLLKRNTFSRYEIDDLRRLLQSRVLEESPGEKPKESEGTALLSGRHGNYDSVPLDNRNEAIGSRGVMQTPNSNFKVHEDTISSPAELAKAYMGGRSSKVSPSMLGIHSQVGRGGTQLLNNVTFSSNSPILRSRPEILTNPGTRVNKFTTPRSGGRSAIYNMARTPYSKFHSTSTMKGNGTTNNGSTELPVSSSSFSPIQHGTLKRRRSILDDEVGSVGRIQRQKTDPFASTTKVGIGSAKKLPLIGKSPGELSKSVGQSGNVNERSTRQFIVPKRSSEVAARILQHLENVSPKGKPAESQLFSMPEKSPFRVTPDVIRKRTVRSMRDVDSSRQDDHKVKDTPDVSLFDSRDSSQKQGVSEENGPKETVAALNTHSPVKNNATAIFLEASDSKPVNLVARNGVSQPLENRVFTMTEQKKSLEREGSIYCNGTATDLLSEGKKSIDDETPKMVKTTTESEIMSISTLLFDKTSEISGTMNHAFPDIKDTSTASQSADFPLPPTENAQTENAENPRILTLSFQSISKMSESILESPCSLVNVSPPTGTEGPLEFENEDLSTTSNGIVPSKEAPASLFTIPSSNHTNQTSNCTSLLLTSSASTNNVTSTSPFGKISSCVEDKFSSSPVFKFGQSPVSSIIESPVEGSLVANANGSSFSMGQTRGIDKPKRRIITFKKSIARNR